MAIPATLFVKTLLQGRQETHFLVMLLSGQSSSDVPVIIPHGIYNDKSAIPDNSSTTLIVNAADTPIQEE